MINIYSFQGSIEPYLFDSFFHTSFDTISDGQIQYVYFDFVYADLRQFRKFWLSRREKGEGHMGLSIYGEDAGKAE